jgi:hypothetical protein
MRHRARPRCTWLAPGPWPLFDMTNRRICATAARASSRAITRTSAGPVGSSSQREAGTHLLTANCGCRVPTALRYEPVILNPRSGRRRGTAEFLGRDEEPTTTPLLNPCRSRDAVRGALADPEDVFGAARVLLALRRHPCLQPRTMKRADAATNARPRFVLKSPTMG